MWGMKFEMHRQELWVVTRAKEVDLLIWKGLAIQTPTRGLIRIYQTSIAKCHGLFYLHLDGAQIIWPHIGNCLQYCHKISLSYSRPLWNTKINLGSLGLVILDWNISEIQKKMLWIVQTNTNRLSRGVYFLFFFLISFHEKFFFEFFSFLLTRKFYQNKCDILTRIDFTVSPWTCLCEFDIFCDTCTIPRARKINSFSFDLSRSSLLSIWLLLLCKIQLYQINLLWVEGNTVHQNFKGRVGFEKLLCSVLMK